MQSRSRIVLFCLFVLFCDNVFAKVGSYDDSTRLLLIALDLEKQNKIKDSLELFEYLFEKQNKYLYLNKMIQLNMKLKRYYTVQYLSHKYATTYSSDEEEIFQHRVKAMVYTGEYDRAITTQKYIIKHYN